MPSDTAVLDTDRLTRSSDTRSNLNTYDPDYEHNHNNQYQPACNLKRPSFCTEQNDYFSQTVTLEEA